MGKIKNHFFEMGLEVARDDSAGYAFIRQREDEASEEDEDGEDDTVVFAQVLRRPPDLSQTIFCWFCFEELARFEQNQEEGDHLYRSA